MMIHKIYGQFMRRFRPARVQRFYRLFSITPETRLLDLGGDVYFWDLAASLGLPIPRVTVVNIRTPTKNQVRPFLKYIVGDARATTFENDSFDVVFSNSVIEHVGDADSQRQFAREVRRLAPNYFVQTPDRRFPIEPHYLAPFVHWLPPGIRSRVIPFSVWGLTTRPSFEQCCEMVREIQLLSDREMRAYFPDADLITERFLGMPKSLIAVRTAQPAAGYQPACNEVEVGAV